MKPRENTIARWEWEVREPWYRRLRWWTVRQTVCRVKGHDYLTKFDGHTKICRRH